MPYHLTTREFNEQVKRLLTNDGLYVMNVVTSTTAGGFPRAALHAESNIPQCVPACGISTLKTRTLPFVVRARSSVHYADVYSPNHRAAKGRGNPELTLMRRTNSTSGLTVSGTSCSGTTTCLLTILLAPVFLEILSERPAGSRKCPARGAE